MMLLSTHCPFPQPFQTPSTFGGFNQNPPVSQTKGPTTSQVMYCETKAKTEKKKKKKKKTTSSLLSLKVAAFVIREHSQSLFTPLLSLL